MTATASSYYPASILLIFLVPALGGLLFGYDIGSTSFAIVSLDATPVMTGIFVAAPSAGALLGSIAMFYIADVIGRKKELQYMAVSCTL